MADISKIKLPSGNEYDIKDAVARQMISGGVSFNIVWTAADYAATSAPADTKLATIPKGVTVYYNNGAGSAVGTLEAGNDTVGKFYLIYSKTQAGTLDAFDEYVTVGEETKAWEKIGDTLIDLSGVVTNVTLNKSTDTVIGSDATFKVTQPTVTLSSSATTSTGAVGVVGSLSQSTSYIGASASGANTAWNSKDAKTVLTGVSATKTNVKATASGGGTSWKSKDAVTAITGVSATNTNVKATASGANTTWKSKDAVTAITGVSATKSHLATSTIYGVGSSTTTASKATAGTSQTTATGAGTATTNNADWLKGCSVTDEVLTIGAASMNTQTTTQYTFSNVTVPIKNSSATTFATGSLATSGGAEVATDVSASSTDSVIGADATFTITQPTISLATGATAGTGVVSLATGVSATDTAEVIGSAATFTNTQPTIALATDATAGTGVISVATDAAASGTASVIGASSTFKITQPTITVSKGTSSGTGKVSVVESSATNAYLTAAATNGAVAWNSKDQVTALKSDTSITVTKGE